MKTLITCLIASCLLVSCTAAQPSPVVVDQWVAVNVKRFIDKEAGAVCWVWYKTGGISCLPISETKLRE